MYVYVIVCPHVCVREVQTCVVYKCGCGNMGGVRVCVCIYVYVRVCECWYTRVSCTVGVVTGSQGLYRESVESDTSVEWGRRSTPRGRVENSEGN